MHIKLQVKCLIVFMGLLWFSLPVSAQSINTQDLSTLKVDELSDNQIRGFMGQAESMGLSESQMIQMAQQRGMSQEEIQKLQSRVQHLDREGTQSKTSKSTRKYTSGRSVNGQDSV